jgi:hypothetical protein
MNKELVDPLAHSRWQYDPADADYAWVAKVMLLASPAREDLIAKTCHLAGMEVATPPTDPGSGASFFYPWIRDPGWVKSQDPDPG